VKLTRSRIIAAIAFLCLLAGSLEIYDPVLPKDAGTVLRAIEDKTELPVTDWAQAITGKTFAKPKQPRSLVDAAIDKMVEQQEVEEAAKALITLKNILFTGVTILGDMELKGIVEPFVNTPMTYEQMLEIGMVVESYYRKNNYLARAILPPQDLTDGVLTVDVIESVFSKVEIEQELEDLPNTQAHVEAIIEAQQKTGEPLNSKSLDRALALANDLPGMSAQGSLREGREAGETELLLKLYQGRTRQTELSLDNAGSRSTGAQRLLATLTWFNPNDIADLFSIVAVHTQGSDYARLAYSVPVGVDGWRIGANTSVMGYEVVVGEPGMVGAVGRAVTQGLEWVYPLLRSDEANATVTLAADTKEFKNTSAQGLLMSDYSAKVLSAQVAGFYRDLNPGGGTGTYSVQVSHGDLNLAGSLSESTDKNGAHTAGSFNKVKFNASWQEALTTKTSAFVSYTAQVADKNLDSSEKMQLGGMNGVRAYPTGEGSGADAQLVQLELRHQLDSGVTLTGFYDWGQVWLYRSPDFPGGPVPGGPVNNHNTYRGFGASIAYTNDDGVNFRATWARRQGHNPNPTQTGNDQDGTRDRNRYWLQVTVPF
jgi:hemolysin activation/secretion protein